MTRTELVFRRYIRKVVLTCALASGESLSHNRISHNRNGIDTSAVGVGIVGQGCRTRAVGQDLEGGLGHWYRHWYSPQGQRRVASMANQQG